MSELPKHRSVSQINSYEKCPYAYYLARIEKAWSRPAAWLAQGSAVHEAAEAYRKAEFAGNPLTLDEAQEVFRTSYQHYINEALAQTPNFEYWFASGPHRGAADIERRYKIGLEQVEKFVNWTDSHPEEVVWIAPDGTPGIEIGFDIDLDGVMVKGYIDAVLDVRGDVIVRDYKTGNQPGDDFQLGVYGVALADQFEIEPPREGDYWMGRTGKPTHPFQIDDWTRERVTERFHALEDNLKKGDFPALPDPDKCGRCDVAVACEFAGG